eukprot:GILJ01008719.1.p1 GENE.GILJ01008719.1~~GILJ01008719.1.p1  ORF type:complete len:624 (-),score=83.02 GILJ01008719.1:159-2030(-)
MNSTESLRHELEKASRSTLVILKNSTRYRLHRQHYVLESGNWVRLPPETVHPGETVQVASVASNFMAGVEGSVTYRCGTGDNITDLHLFWTNPFIGAKNFNAAKDVRGARAPKLHILSRGNKNHNQEVLYEILELEKPDDATPEADSEPQTVVEKRKVRPRVEWESALRTAKRNVLCVIVNLTTHELVRRDDGALQHGVWQELPPERIPSMAIAEFGCQSQGFMTGTEGEVRYAVLTLPGSFQFYWNNPYLGKPAFNGISPFSKLNIITRADNLPSGTVKYYVVDREAPVPLVMVGARYADVDVTSVLQSMVTGAFKHELKAFGAPNTMKIAFASKLNGAPQRTGLVVQFQIGCEVFRRQFAEDESVFMSTLIPGGCRDGVDVFKARSAPVRTLSIPVRPVAADSTDETDNRNSSRGSSLEYTNQGPVPKGVKTAVKLPLPIVTSPGTTARTLQIAAEARSEQIIQERKRRQSLRLRDNTQQKLLESIGLSLRLLADGLQPFIEKAMIKNFGSNWLSRGDVEPWHIWWVEGSNAPKLDAQGMLIILLRHWEDIFEALLGKSAKTVLNELQSIRNKWAHQVGFDNENASEDADRALDMIAGLLKVIGADFQSNGVEEIRQKVIR